MNSIDLKSHSNSVYRLRYQLVLVTDKQKDLLTPRVRTRLEQLIHERVEAWDGELLSLDVKTDRVIMK